MIRERENKKEQITFFDAYIFGCIQLFLSVIGYFWTFYAEIWESVCQFGKSAGQLYESCFHGAGTDSGDNDSASY